MFEFLKRPLKSQPAPATTKGVRADSERVISGDARASYDSGLASLAQGDAAAALSSFRNATALSPEFARAHHCAALALRELGRTSEAIEAFQRAIDLQFDSVDSIVGMGEVHAELGNNEDAQDCFQLALAFDCDCSSAHSNLGRLLLRSGELDAALEHHTRLLALQPSSAQAHFEGAQTYARRAEVQNAVEHYLRAVELQPDFAEAYVNLGMLHLSTLGNPAAAQALFEQALKIRPDFLEARANLALALQERGDFSAALHLMDQALERWPQFEEFRWNRGLVRLTWGDYRGGWDDYAARKRRAGGIVHRKFPYRDWGGEPLRDSNLLVYAEQGLGDEIMFASCLPDVVRAARSCVIECNTRLERLFRRSFPQAKVHGALRDGDRSWLSAYPGIDLQAAIGDLPRYLRNSSEDFPAHAGYLQADPQRANFWRTQLAAGAKAVKVGIAWRGGTRETRQAQRSSRLLEWLPVLRRQNVQFISLQHGEISEEIDAAAAQGVELGHWPDALQDLDEMAALMTVLDLVITVDSTVAHLAGALGREVWIMLPHSPDWRWLWQGSKSTWYPTATLYRQAAAGGWQPLLSEAAAQLDQLLRSK
jgi:tetratricopeptide (TPR) repeat protein